MSVTCSTAGVVTNAACYTRQTLTPAQQKALLILAKANACANATGPNYLLSLSTTLVTDASQMVCGILPDQLYAGQIAIWMEAGGITSNTLTSKLDSVKCLANLDPLTLEKIDVFLTCKFLAALGL